jgi:hypothetical protein
MEVMRLASSHGGAADQPFDVSRLHPEERKLWEDHFASSSGEEGEVMRVWSFGYGCMLELWGPPPVVCEYLAKHDPDNLIGQYIENVRRARREGRL